MNPFKSPPIKDDPASGRSDDGEQCRTATLRLSGRLTLLARDARVVPLPNTIANMCSICQERQRANI